MIVIFVLYKNKLSNLDFANLTLYKTMKFILSILIAQCLSISIFGQMERAVEAKTEQAIAKPFVQETKYERMLNNAGEFHLLENVNVKGMSYNNIELKKIESLNRKIEILQIKESLGSNDQQVLADCKWLKLKKQKSILITMNKADYMNMNKSDQQLFLVILGESNSSRKGEFKSNNNLSH